MLNSPAFFLRFLLLLLFVGFSACIEDPATFLPNDPGSTNQLSNQNSADADADGIDDPLACEAPLNQCQPADEQAVCADLSTDIDHCGQCNRRCPDALDDSPPICTDGRCSYQCDAPQTACSRGCADLATDPDHCGECGLICRSGRCDSGRCLPFECAPQDAPFGGGSGTRTDPYRICTPEHFLQIGADTDLLISHFVLSADIDLTDQPLSPIGSLDTPFDAELDGFKFSITGIDLAEDVDAPMGVFAALGPNAYITNLHLEGSVSGRQTVGLLTGVNRGAIENLTLNGEALASADTVGLIAGENHGRIQEVAVTGAVHAEEHTVGGLVGRNLASGEVLDVSAQITITGSASSAGGLIGVQAGSLLRGSVTGTLEGGSESGGAIGRINQVGSIRNVDSAVSVTGAGPHTGGLVGLLTDTAEIIQCQSTGSVTNFSAGLVGGLVGHASGESDIRRSSATGEVQSDRDYIGGLVGLMDENASLSDSYSSSAISTDGSAFVGGLIGATDENVEVSRSYSTGAISSTEGPTGGLIGEMRANSEVQLSYSTSTILAEKQPIGGLVGQMTDASRVSSCLADAIVTRNDSDRATGGLVGRLVDTALIQGSASHSSVASLGRFVGGLLGEGDNDFQVHRSYATGHVSGLHSVGGLIGRSRANGIIRDVYATGNATTLEDRVGGLIGRFTGDLRFAYSSGTPTAQSGARIGGLVGHLDGGSFQDATWDRETSQIETDPTGISSLSTSEFGASTPFQSWDFNQTWRFSSDSPRRPILQLQLPEINE